ncbi:MAG TPA: response regulator [candidate division Zixibacteria bacterium]|nr:response regulator [candidate division Zixibacteria bacterium]
MKRSVLVVDDEPQARSMMRLILVRAGFDVVEAKDGYQALDEVERQIPDLMILDIMMPGIDGFYVCEQLRSDEKTANLPIIVLSAMTDADSVNRGKEVGATMYLKKPVSPDDLTRHVQEVIDL